MIVIYYDSVDKRVVTFNKLYHLYDCVEEDYYEDWASEATPCHRADFCLSFNIECWNIFGKVIIVT